MTETKLATLEFFVNIRRTLLLYCRMRVLSSPQYNSHSVQTETRAELSLSIVSNSRSESANWNALLQNFLTQFLILSPRDEVNRCKQQ